MFHPVRMTLIAICLSLLCLLCNGNEGAEVQNESNFNEVSEQILKVNWEFFKTFFKYNRFDAANIVSPILFTRIICILTSGSTDKLPLELEDFFQVDHESMKRFHMGHIASINERKLNEHIALKGTFYVREPVDKKLSKPYFDELKSSYNTTFLTNKYYDATTALNALVKASTKRINNFFHENMFHENELGAVFNTIYFHGKWKYAFDATKTKQVPFYYNKVGPTSLRVYMMQMESQFKAKIDFRRKIKYLELPLLEEKGLSLIIILPIERHGWNDLEVTLSTLKEIIYSEKPLQNITLYLPQFRISKRQELGHIMRSFGMRAMFNSNSTFDKLSSSYKEIHANEIYQESVLEIRPRGIQGSSVINAHLNLYQLDDMESPRPDRFIQSTQAKSEEQNITPSKFMTNRGVFRCDEPFYVILLDKWQNIPLVWGAVNFLDSDYSVPN